MLFASYVHTWAYGRGAGQPASIPRNTNVRSLNLDWPELAGHRRIGNQSEFFQHKNFTVSLVSFLKHSVLAPGMFAPKRTPVTGTRRIIHNRRRARNGRYYSPVLTPVIARFLGGDRQYYVEQHFGLRSPVLLGELGSIS